MATGQLLLTGFSAVARGRRDHPRPLSSFLLLFVLRGPGFLELSQNWTHCQWKPGHCLFRVGPSATPPLPALSAAVLRAYPGGASPAPSAGLPFPGPGRPRAPCLLSLLTRHIWTQACLSAGLCFFSNFTFDCHGNCCMFGEERGGEKLGEKKRRSQRGAGRRPGGSCRRAERGLWRAARLQRTKLSVPHVGGKARLAPLYGFPELPALAAVHRLQGSKQD